MVGDATREATWSGIPRHLLEAARPRGFLQGGLALAPERLRGRRALWNLGQLLTTGERGGFQYTAGFLDALWAQRAGEAEGAEILTHFALLPPESARVERMSCYIDATLRQNFEEYGLAAIVSSRVRADALARERAAYERAERVVCMSRWAARSVVEAYGIAAAKVHVVRAGANLDEVAVASLPPHGPVDRSELRLGFVGKDWRRKGLPFLLEVAEAIEARGQRVRVLALGPSPADVPAHRLLEPLGYFDKTRDLARFATAARRAHFGCLFSFAEALGISTLEFLRLGVPVAGVDLGGIPDCIDAGVGLLAPAQATPGAVAIGLLDLWEPMRYDGLLAAVRARSGELTWDQAVTRLQALWPRA
ncbi:MAG: glycosyltransferase family 4 protein [Anaeromyxobacteraceae bacterium]